MTTLKTTQDFESLFDVFKNIKMKRKKHFRLCVLAKHKLRKISPLRRKFIVYDNGKVQGAVGGYASEDNKRFHLILCYGVGDLLGINFVKMLRKLWQEITTETVVFTLENTKLRQRLIKACGGLLENSSLTNVYEIPLCMLKNYFDNLGGSK